MSGEMAWLPDNVEIVVEKGGEEVDTLPEELKRDMEFLYDKGHDPEQQLSKPNAVLPTIAQAVSLDEEGDMEAQVRGAVLAVAREEPINRSILFDLKTLEELLVVERVLTKMKEFMEANKIRYLLTPRTRERILEIKRRQEEFILAKYSK